MKSEALSRLYADESQRGHKEAAAQGRVIQLLHPYARASRAPIYAVAAPPGEGTAHG
jgi:hypothetical protein